MKKILVALSAAFLVSSSVASAGCWSITTNGVPSVTLDITQGKSTQTFADVNPQVPGKQEVVLECVGFLSKETGGESMTCYDDAGDLGYWIVHPSIQGDKATVIFMLFPTFNPESQPRMKQFELVRCIKT